MLASIKTWGVILRICLEERLVYRGDFALGTLMRFLPIVTQIFLWAAIFSAIESQQARDRGAVSQTDTVQVVHAGAVTNAAGGPSAAAAQREQNQRGSSNVDGESEGETNPPEPTIRGFTYRNMVAYYLLTMISRAFSSMPNLASGIALEIREGTIKKFLIQPIDMIDFLLLNRVAHKLVYYSVALGPFALVFYLCRSYFDGWPDASTMAVYVVSLLLSFLLGFLLEATIGLIGFWFLEVSSLLFIYMLFSFFFSGHMFPIDMLPGVWRTIVEMTPLQYLAYFPAAVFLGKVQGTDLAWGLAMQFGWVIFFGVLVQVAFRLGVRRYSAFGG